MARPNVPKFGAGTGAAYTAVFDQARTGKNGKPINPNDPAENVGLYGYMPPLPSQRNSERPPRGHDENRPRHERRSSREDLDVRRSNDPPSRQPPYPGQAPARKPPGGVGARGGAEGPPTRPDRDGSNHTDRDGSSHHTDRSPAHPHANRVGARENRRGAASPTWERRGRQPSGGDEGSLLGSGAPKPRMRPAGPREEPPTKGGALPAFGAWDVKDPNAGDGFTMIFQKLSNEKKEGGPVHIPKLNTEQLSSHEKSYDKHNQSNGSRDKKQSSQPVLLENNAVVRACLESCLNLYSF
ncbi:RPM1-interacting protein 4 isoform X2 [Physcomitrium patens]|uniref:RIN4 pathogenic type III effector avirulence factor Avr cleavage site domain-containing protein n=1 Tax=Physcomitrium patens TaxID=3218 RepID=A0A7I4AMQ4_PHYPA|nr:RPM1-interacting protein 4-like isoform X2 [Physcomitrium patens]|eukprot:XP_024395726.1 RPM1-interacting protein 4-like isoform X2 [Physcomitrella patens]